VLVWQAAVHLVFETLLALVLCAVIVNPVARLLSDRKRLMARPATQRKPVTSGGCVSCIPVEVSLSAEDVRDLAELVIARVRGQNVAMWDDSTVTGFQQGPNPQQVSVRIGPAAPDGRRRLYCCSRPRYTARLWDSGKHRVMAQWLADEVRNETSDIPL
jgi:hypothetical protein